MRISATHPFVNHVRQTHFRLPAHIHAHLDENRHNSRILTNWALTLCTHTRVDQNLRHRVFCRLRLFSLIGLVHCLDKVSRMVVRNKLQRIRYTIDKVVLANRSHGLSQTRIK